MQTSLDFKLSGLRGLIVGVVLILITLSILVGTFYFVWTWLYNLIGLWASIVGILAYIGMLYLWLKGRLKLSYQIKMKRDKDVN
jgi:hypothetical protein